MKIIIALIALSCMTLHIICGTREALLKPCNLDFFGIKRKKKKLFRICSISALGVSISIGLWAILVTPTTALATCIRLSAVVIWAVVAINYKTLRKRLN
jgi:hypothetical protein